MAMTMTFCHAPTNMTWRQAAAAAWQKKEKQAVTAWCGKFDDNGDIQNLNQTTTASLGARCLFWRARGVTADVVRGVTVKH